MQDPGRVSELIHLIYDTVGSGPDSWRIVLERLFELVNAHMGSVIHFANGDMEALLMGSEERSQQEYRDYFVRVDPWVPLSHHYVVPPGGSLEASHELVPDSVLHQTEFYHDFGRKVGYGYGFGFGIDPGNGVKTVISAVRDSSPFSTGEFAWLLLLRPHFQQALRLNQTFSGIRSEREALLESIDRLGHGIILCDGGARILVTNKSAERMASAKDGWTIVENHLRARLARDTDKIHALISSVVNTNGAGGIVSVARPSGRRPWMLTVTRYGSSASRSMSCIVISDPDIPIQPDADIIRELYGFTPAEIRLAQLLLNGERLDDAARGLRITMNTARTHVKRMLSKAAVRSQAELIALLSRIPARASNIPGLGDDSPRNSS